MYSKDKLMQYPYFAEILNQTSIDTILDPLTGVVSRKYMLGFAHDLMNRGIPFTFGMMDLDNFKYVNDTYGHSAGDGVLTCISSDLASFLTGFGVAGRFGGDELLFINLRDIAYDDKKAFCNELYESSVLRRNVELDGCSPFITATIGCATFPDDATTYDDLFALIDKTLYRGKTKGRNCYIIYVEAKHKNIEIKKLSKGTLYDTMHSMVRKFEMVPGLVNRLSSVTPILMEDLRVSDLYYIGQSNVLRSVRNPDICEPVSDIKNIMNDDMFTTNTIEEIAGSCPQFYSVLMKLEIETLLVVRIGIEQETYGYLLFAEPRNRRIWQDSDCSTLLFLSKMVAAQAYYGKEPL